jgi:uncharacterized membrane protein
VECGARNSEHDTMERGKQARPFDFAQVPVFAVLMVSYVYRLIMLGTLCIGLFACFLNRVVMTSEDLISPLINLLNVYDNWCSEEGFFFWDVILAEDLMMRKWGYLKTKIILLLYFVLFNKEISTEFIKFTLKK